MSERIAIEIDTATGERTERNLTVSELADLAQITIEGAGQMRETKAKATAKAAAQAKLAALGLTVEDLQALGF